jgi:SAM-dependent methyltransferase
MQEPKNKEWFEDWFNSPYYHILYGHRDQCEADRFLDALIAALKPAPGARFLDLACGKGRHSFYLSKMGFDVTGIDLSPESIRCASVKENDHLHFYVHDMRKLFRTNYFDVVLNLFTSFGYFSKESDHQATVAAVAKGLKENGIFVLDFMNVEKVLRELVAEEERTIEGIHFQVSRKAEDGFIQKCIHVSDKGKELDYCEKVRAFTPEELQKCIENAGLKIIALYGDYELRPFHPETSGRLLILAKKQTA